MAMRSLSPITGIGDASSKLEAFRSKLTAGSFGKLRDQIKALYEKHDPSRFLESRQADQLEKLADAYKEGSLVVVLGAGASKDYGLPAWDDLMLELHARTFDQDDPKKDKIDKPTRELLSALLLFFAPGNPVVFARQIMRRLGGEKHKRSEKIIQLSEILQEILYQKVKQPANSAYKVLARMLKTSPTDKGIHCIITYNYDNMLEREIENAGFYNCQPFWSDRDELDKTKKPVFHVHGYLPHSISLKSQPILAEDLYHEQYGTPYAWNNVVQLNKFSELTCLFIGCSFADPNLRRLMDIPRKLWKPKTTRHFLINKQQDDDEMPFHLGLALQRLAVLQSRRTEGWDRKLALKEAHEVQRQILRIVDAIGAEDLQEFGVETIWIKEYEEIPSILERIGGILGGRI
ncbi:MAG: SIR2 family protein [Desulfomonile tiedjei]|uniref:SIR2 family protein n=1 Tax=Desulfomonile tiedjei TaxID=2358 RepID=A0A9D6Z5W6_9BACT|nr:SIR2 family protein [Desulfomonile tiedjei]